MIAGSKPRKNSSRLIVAVSLPKDLVELMSNAGSHNRSALIAEAVEMYLRVKEPALYKIMQISRMEADEIVEARDIFLDT